MVMDDIEIVFEDFTDLRGFKKRPSCQIGREGREKPKWTFQPMYFDVGVVPGSPGRFAGRQKSVRVHAVYDLYPVPLVCQCTGQSLHEDPIPAEVVRRIEGCDHTES